MTAILKRETFGQKHTGRKPLKDKAETEGKMSPPKDVKELLLAARN